MKRIFQVLIFLLRSISFRNKLELLGLVLWLTLLASLDAGSLWLLGETLKNSSSQSLFEKAPELLAVAILFITKNIFSGLAYFVTQKKFEKFEVQIGESNFESYMALNWYQKSKFSEVDLLNLIDKAPFSAVRGILYSSVTIFSEALSSLAILAILFTNNSVVALTVLFYFVAVMQIQNKSYGRVSDRLGKKTYEFSNELASLVLDFHKMGKIFAVNRATTLERELTEKRRDLVPVRGAQSFIETLPRFYVEAVLVLGLLLASGVAYVTFGADSVFPAISLFAAAGYRLLPTLNRIQGAISFSRMNLDMAEVNLLLSKTLENSREEALNTEFTERDEIHFRNVTFFYPGSKIPALHNFSFTFSPGKKYALIGPSGSGKTTVADLCLGLWSPTKGKLFLPKKMSKSYVPQKIEVISGTLEKNVFLSTDLNNDRAKVDSILKLAGIKPDSIRSNFSNNNQKRAEVSGGQMQRLGIARARYTDADLEIFDEATSALDNKLESKVMQLIGKPKPTKIFIVIAHRLSTIRDADEILYIKNGRLLGSGNWDSLGALVPEFLEQMKLAE